MQGPQGQKPLGQMLVEKGLITEEQLNQALEAQKQTTSRIGEVLIDLGFVDERSVYETLGEQLHVKFIDLSKFAIDRDVASLITREMAERYEAIPIARGEANIRVAMSEPGDVMALDDLKVRCQVTIEPVLATSPAIKKAIEEVYGTVGEKASGGSPAAASLDSIQDLSRQVGESGVLGARVDLEEAAGGEREQRIEQLTDEAPIIKIAKVLIQRSIQERASDIHVEPERRGVRIRYRIDGVLHEMMKVPKYVHAPLISRLKIMSELDIAERRLPQDGRIHIRHGGKDFDLRCSTIPTTLGEKFVARILDKSSVLLGLDNLGLMSDTQSELEKLIVQPNGMLLSTGPTGSGKTTTQYSILNIISTVEKNVITIEDPVEYQLAGISQVHVNRRAGLTFAVALKYFMRQDPDIIMVGEIRDLETSEIAIQASLTGHLVLSTLHTNDAPSTVTRLVDMGVEPFLISASVIGALAQRLGRRICTECREEHQPAADTLLGLGLDPDECLSDGWKFYRGTGCDKCRHTGYYGRIGIFELMVMTDEIRELIVRRASAAEIKEASLATGMMTLYADAMRKVKAGVIDVDEVLRVIFTAGASMT
jgi:type IV pilus assembly protein PilB